jgi:hypothetical protein
MRALYGQAQALPASLFELGISPHINASIIVSLLLILPKEVLPSPWAARLREARKEGKGVSGSRTYSNSGGRLARTHGCLRTTRTCDMRRCSVAAAAAGSRVPLAGMGLVSSDRVAMAE